MTPFALVQLPDLLPGDVHLPERVPSPACGTPTPPRSTTPTPAAEFTQLHDSFKVTVAIFLGFGGFEVTKTLAVRGPDLNAKSDDLPVSSSQIGDCPAQRLRRVAGPNTNMMASPVPPCP